MKRCHLQGMGIYGCMLAWQLYNRTVPFTWEDTHQKICAWRASTGAIYPSGSGFDQWNYNVWAKWKDEPPWQKLGAELVEPTMWWYCTKSAPHALKLKAAVDVGALRMAPIPSFHFNAQKFVKLTREFFQPLCRPSESGSQLVVSHGFGERLHHVLWGWTSKVKLAYAKEIDQFSHMWDRPSFYMRRGRFKMAYAFAVPGENTWYAGSSLIVQKKPNSLAIPPKFAMWKRDFEQLSGGMVQVIGDGELVEGWRPAAALNDTPLAKRMGEAVVMKPLWNSGIRHSPAVLEATLELLG